MTLRKLAAIAGVTVAIGVGLRALSNTPTDPVPVDPHAGHMAMDQAPAAPAALPPFTTKKDSLPAADEMAKATIDKSPRKSEFVSIMAGTQPIRTFVVHPSQPKAPVVVVISDNRGLSDWIRALGDQLAQEGFIAVVPDMMSGLGPNGGGTEAFESSDAVTRAIGQLTRDEVMKRANAVRDYGLKLPAANGKSGSIGFCWGGGHSFSFAASQASLNAAVVFYGSPPPAALIAAIKAPVQGNYAGDDARINASIDATKAEMAKLGKAYEVNIYDGAGHGFMRSQSARAANAKAAEDAWPKAVAFLKKNTM